MMGLKKFYVTARIKNDSDIIESFCRWYANFFDGMIICDDSSDDNTVDIIESLINEGLNIKLLHRADYPKDLRKPDLPFISFMIDMAFDQYNADAVLPIDADEFLYSSTGANPRSILEQMDERAVHKIRTHNAVFKKAPDDSVVFLPEYFSEYLDEEVGKAWHLIVTRYIFKERKGRLTVGKHGIGFPDCPAKPPPTEIEATSLYLAHFSVRSPASYTLKISTGWLTFQMFNIDAAFHWKSAYEFIKKNGMLDSEHSRSLSLYLIGLYGDPGRSPESYIHKTDGGFMRTDFLTEPIKLHYTDYGAIEKSFFGLVLSHAEYLLLSLRDMPEKAELEATKSGLTAAQAEIEVTRNELGVMRAELEAARNELNFIKRSRLLRFFSKFSKSKALFEK